MIWINDTIKIILMDKNLLNFGRSIYNDAKDLTSLPTN